MIDKKKQYARQHEWDAKNYDKITIQVKKGVKDKWKQKASDEGKSLREWIMERCGD